MHLFQVLENVTEFEDYMREVHEGFGADDLAFQHGSRNDRYISKNRKLGKHEVEDHGL